MKLDLPAKSAPHSVASPPELSTISHSATLIISIDLATITARYFGKGGRDVPIMSSYVQRRRLFQS